MHLLNEVLKQQKLPDQNSTAYIHLMSEIGKRVFADRAEYMGDPDFVEVPVKALLEPAYITARAGEGDPEAISVTEDVKPGLYESPDTTHFSVMDKWGNAVANTTTINLSFGSGVVVEGAGFLLNDEMDDFSAKPGVPNAYGLIGGTANAVAPNKRMLSSMSPTIVLKDGEPAQTASFGDEVEIVLDRTPFYAEGGGQVGDAGAMTGSGGAEASITDTQRPVGDLISHRVTIVNGTLSVGDAVRVAVDADRRLYGLSEGVVLLGPDAQNCGRNAVGQPLTQSLRQTAEIGGVDDDDADLVLLEHRA